MRLTVTIATLIVRMDVELVANKAAATDVIKVAKVIQVNTIQVEIVRLVSIIVRGVQDIVRVPVQDRAMAHLIP